MILILTNHGDLSSDLVFNHIKRLGGNCLRINSFELLDKPLCFAVHKKVLSIGDKIIKASDIGAVWFRKFGFFRKSRQALELRSFLEPTAQSNISIEFAKIIEAFGDFFSASFWLTNPKYIKLNKYIVLKKAMAQGLDIPTTYITNNINDLKKIQASELKLISKSINDPFILELEGTPFSMYTTLIKEDDIEKIPLVFMPSLIQKAIPKQFEIRVFYLMGKCYSMAIMSQEDRQTSVDFRKYNFKNPNRFLPFSLPKEIEFKISMLMKELCLNTGSIDFILTPDNRYVFLEINPTGQFGMVDFPCNYGLHEKVAQLLIFEDKKRCYEKSV